MAKPETIYTIPPSAPFGRTLASGLMKRAQETGEPLSETLILLPTRRACRTMRDTFLKLSHGKPLLLPRLQPLGDIDEEELALNLAGTDHMQSMLEIPPALPPLRRQILLSKLIMARPDFNGGFDQALKLAKALGQFIDHIYIEELDFESLQTLVPENFADHWQITLEFLKILGENWPAILATENMIDAADRRARLMQTLTTLWEERPPAGPVIAAGSTGTMPATARLMKLIATLPKGQLILPGYDPDLDEESWEALEPSHPQYGFKDFFTRTNTDRTTIKIWPGIEAQQTNQNRTTLAREIMRPPQTTAKWLDLSTGKSAREKINAACENISLITAATGREEAEIIALTFREILEEPAKTAALITPDRALARRVTAACTRWNITVDDSAGLTLPQTSLGAFLLLILETALENLSPPTLLALLKHPLCHAGLDKQIFTKAVSALDEHILRGPKPKGGFEALHDRLQKHERISEQNRDAIKILLQTLEPILNPLLTLCQKDEPENFQTILKTHIETAQNLNAADENKNDNNQLWSGDTGEQTARFFAELLQETHLIAPLKAPAYKQGLKTLMEAITIRPAYGTHPRLMILGQLEARLIDADLIILSGLNEGTWPAKPSHDPWMSRPMRRDFGLPAPERELGLAAHDFVQALCANEGDPENPGRVILTHAKKVDGAPAVPARWLQRLETVLNAANIDPKILQQKIYQTIIRKLDEAPKTNPLERPQPRPPREARPTKLSVTKIETWLQDPYQIYARYVLNLKPLDPIDQRVDAATRGSVLHDILERFILAHPEDMPDDPYNELMSYAENALTDHDIAPEDWSFWWPRFETLANWFIAHETEWRTRAKPLKTESKGEIDLSSKLDKGTFTLHGIADRIDRLQDGSAAIIDYKSGGSFSKSGMISGQYPQLPLEALILSEGGFENLSAYNPAILSYWKLSGGRDTGSKTELDTAKGDNLTEAIEKAREGLIALVKTYQDETAPYFAQPRTDRLPRFNDYAHLARTREWSANANEEEAA